MKKLTALLIALMTVLTLMIPVFASAEASSTTRWVNCANGYRLNVRSGPSTDSPLLYRLDCGTRVEINNMVGVPNGWAFVTTSGHREGGFVMTKFLVDKKGMVVARFEPTTKTEVIEKKIEELLK